MSFVSSAMPDMIRSVFSFGRRNTMARNIEFKARIVDIRALSEQIAPIATSGPIELFQDDTFFHCSAGRLKLRTFSPDRGELIFYTRTDQPGPRESFYVISETHTPDSLRELLSLSFGQSGRVQKHRTLYLIGRTRIHLDRVRDLGDFFECEVVLEDGEAIEIGMAEANTLLEQLHIPQSDLIDVAYLDLIRTQSTGPGGFQMNSHS